MSGFASFGEMPVGGWGFSVESTPNSQENKSFIPEWRPGYNDSIHYGSYTLCATWIHFFIYGLGAALSAFLWVSLHGGNLEKES